MRGASCAGALGYHAQSLNGGAVSPAALGGGAPSGIRADHLGVLLYDLGGREDEA